MFRLQMELRYGRGNKKKAEKLQSQFMRHCHQLFAENPYIGELCPEIGPDAYVFIYEIGRTGPPDLDPADLVMSDDIKKTIEEHESKGQIVHIAEDYLPLDLDFDRMELHYRYNPDISNKLIMYWVEFHDQCTPKPHVEHARNVWANMSREAHPLSDEFTKLSDKAKAKRKKEQAAAALEPAETDNPSD
jgi:hypothetical protein